jgi:iron complex outermembrane recepter protein
VDADISYSRIERKDRVLETYSGTGSNQVGTPDRLTVTMGESRGATFTPTLDYTDTTLVRLGSPQGWGGDVVPGGQVGYLKNPKAEDALTLFKISGKRKFDGWFSELDIGGSFSNRTKTEVEDGYYLALANGQTTAPLPAGTGITDLSFIGVSGMASYDPLKALYSDTYLPLTNPNADVISNDWDVEEKVSIVYVQLAIDHKLGSLPLTGNIGVQFVHTDQSSRGLSAVPIGGRSVNVPTEGGDQYWNVLPSLNLKLQLAERRFFRFSMAQQLARQRMADMRAGRNTTFNSNLANSPDPGDAWKATGGNPELRPWRSNSVDIAFEQYFRDNMGYFSVAGFYKDLRTYTYNQTVIADFTGFPSGGVTPATYLGTLVRPSNGDGGKIQGAEMTLSLPSELISPSIRGFGIIVSGAYNDSNIQANGPGSGDVTIPGLSQKVASATIYYERKGFSARVSERYRSAYRGNIYTFGARGENYRTIATEQVIDAQLSYEFKTGALKGLTVILQGYNLTNEPLQTSDQNDARLVVDYQEYGASYSAGVSYKF